MENDEQHYESEANEDWVCSGMISFKMSFVGRERKSLKVYIIVISISFSYSKCVLEGDRAEADENHLYVWMRQTMRWRRVWEPSGWEGPERCSLGGRTTPHRMWFWWDTQQNQCNGPRIPSDSTESNPGFRPISLSPCIYPRLLFLYCNRLKSFLLMEVEGFQSGPHKQSLFSRP